MVLKLFIISMFQELFLSKGYIEVEIEAPIVTQDVIFITSSPLNGFLSTFIIVDEDDEEVQDNNLRQNVDLKNFCRLGAPIRTQMT